MKYFKWVTGIIVGAALGFAYWYFVGCNTGTCAITSSPINSTLYGSLIGALVVNSFSSNQTQKSDNQ